ncbi:MAG: hypothetical protein ABEH56_01155 [Salinirussus sp.]
MSDDRGVSFALNYVLALGIAALLMTALIVAAGDYVSQQRESVVRSELEVIGHQLAAAAEESDRLVRAGESVDTVRLNQTAPAKIAGSTYAIRVDPEGPGSPETELHLNATGVDVSVTVEAETTTNLASTSIEGGSVVIEYDPAADELVLTNE